MSHRAATSRTRSGGRSRSAKPAATAPGRMVRRVIPRGIWFRDEFYTDHRLAPHVGRWVEVMRAPAEVPTLAIYRVGGPLICTAVRHCDLSPEERVRIVLTRGELRREDRMWWRELMTRREVDGREAVARADAAAALKPSGLGPVETLFGRLPSKVNRTLSDPSDTGTAPPREFRRRHIRPPISQPLPDPDSPATQENPPAEEA